MSLQFRDKRVEVFMNQIVIVLNVKFQTEAYYMKEKFYESGRPEVQFTHALRILYLVEWNF